MSPSTEWSPAAELAAVMAGQSGLVTADQAAAAGYPRPEIQRLRSAGHLESVRRGVYAIRDDYRALGDLDRHRVDVRAVLLRCSEPTVISHESAAVLLDLALLRPALEMVHATRPELRASRREAGVHHHPGSLPEGHVVRAGDAQVTSPARTAVDIARTNDFPRGLAVVDSVLRSGVCAADVRRVLEFCACWPGARGASRAVASGDGRAANPGESWSRAVLMERGLSPDELQLAVNDDRGLVGYADFAWREQRVIGEFDGRGKYGLEPGALTEQSAGVLWREKRREDRLRALGWLVVRWTWADLYRPDVLAERVRAALRGGPLQQRRPGA